MPIRTIRFADITADDARALLAREVREDRTLDFKQEFSFSDSGKLDLLQDVTAMANASGGTILYGAVEGDGDDKGRIVALKGLALQRDDAELLVSNLLRDNIDERIVGIEHRAIPFDAGTYLYIIRVPASPRAPHMITRASNRSRFYMRGTVSNDPMNAQQIREAALRSATAFDRAREFIRERITTIDQLARDRYSRLNNRGVQPPAELDFVAVHLIPLFPPVGGHDLTARALTDRWMTVSPFGQLGPMSVLLSFDGLRSEYRVDDSGGHLDWAMLLRRGGLEFMRIENLHTRGTGGVGKTIDGLSLELDTLAVLQQARSLSDEGVLTLPFALSLQLAHVHGIVLTAPGKRPPMGSVRAIEIDNVPIEPVIVNRWDEADAAIRGIFHVMWQAWGWPRSPYYDPSGERQSQSY